jgi:hypothetical protein
MAVANARMSTRPTRSPHAESGRNPTANPTPTRISTCTVLFRLSESSRPVRTALRAIGRLRSRSMKPFCRSSHNAKPVVPALNRAVCTAMPGMR